jgi:hypothetical protein
MAADSQLGTAKGHRQSYVSHTRVRCGCDRHRNALRCAGTGVYDMGVQRVICTDLAACFGCVGAAGEINIAGAGGKAGREGAAVAGYRPGFHCDRRRSSYHRGWHGRRLILAHVIEHHDCWIRRGGTGGSSQSSSHRDICDEKQLSVERPAVSRGEIACCSDIVRLVRIIDIELLHVSGPDHAIRVECRVIRPEGKLKTPFG